MGTISSANAVVTLSQPTLFPAPVQMKGFAVDDIYDVDEVRSIEALMGVDGVLSFGFVFVPINMRITLQADSKSVSFFDTLYTQSQAAKDVYPLTGTIILPSISSKFTMTNGGLIGYKPAPDGKRVLQPRRFAIIWQTWAPAPA